MDSMNCKDDKPACRAESNGLESASQPPPKHEEPETSMEEGAAATNPPSKNLDANAPRSSSTKAWKEPAPPTSLLDALRQEERIRSQGVFARVRKYLGGVARLWNERDQTALVDRAIGSAHRGHALYHSVVMDLEYLEHLGEAIFEQEDAARNGTCLHCAKK